MAGRPARVPGLAGGGGRRPPPPAPGPPPPRAPAPRPAPALAPPHHGAAAAPAEFGPAADELIRVCRRMKATPAETIGTRTFPALGTFASLLVTDPRSMELAF